MTWDDTTGNTVFACLKGGPCNVVVGVIWGGHNDEVYLRAAEDLVKGAIDLDWDAETGIDLACRRGGIALEDGVEAEEMGQSKDEGNVERKPRQPDAYHAYIDFHIVKHRARHTLRRYDISQVMYRAGASRSSTRTY